MAKRAGAGRSAANRLSEPFDSWVVRELYEVAAQDGYHPMVIETRFFDGSGAVPVWPVDGIIAFASSAWAERFRHTQNGRDVPIVLFQNDEPSAHDAVWCALYAGARAAAEHLAEHCKTVALLLPPLDAQRDERLRAYRDVMNARGLPEIIINTPHATREAVHDTLLDFAKRNPWPEGLFCFNDSLAVAALRAVCDAGQRVPDDVRIVGFDGLSDGDFCVPRLTSVQIPVAAMCAAAWQFLQHRIEEPNAPLQRANFQAQLLVRESS